MNVTCLLNNVLKALEFWFVNEDYRGCLALDNKAITRNMPEYQWKNEWPGVLNKKLRHLDSPLRIECEHLLSDSEYCVTLKSSDDIDYDYRFQAGTETEKTIEVARTMWEDLTGWGFYERSTNG